MNENPLSAAVEVVLADLSREDHQREVLALTQAYALDAMGNGGPLPEDVVDRLIPALREHPTTLIFLARIAGQAAGIATCFVGFSTFAARPLINIHDLAVLPEFRGAGVGRSLLAAVEAEARRRGYARLTLEVQEKNHRARAVYASFGFSHAALDRSPDGQLFCTKHL